MSKFSTFTVEELQDRLVNDTRTLEYCKRTVQRLQDQGVTLAEGETEEVLKQKIRNIDITLEMINQVRCDYEHKVGLINASKGIKVFQDNIKDIEREIALRKVLDSRSLDSLFDQAAEEEFLVRYQD